MTEAVALVAIVVTVLVALVTIARENRYRFIDRKLELYTELIQTGEARHDVIYWQLEDQASAAKAGRLAKDARIRTVGPGGAMGGARGVERARSAIRLATSQKAVDDAAQALLVTASDLGQVAYVAPRDDQLVPAPDRAEWNRLDAAYTAAWEAFIKAAKNDVETCLKVGLRWW